MADQRETLFDLPTEPDEFGVLLPPANLKRLDFSGLEYTTARRAILEYIKTYFPNEFNDFVASNGIMMIMEILASITGKLSLRSDMLANEAFLTTAKTEEAIINHLALINQKLKRQTPSVVDIEISVDQEVFSDIEILAGTMFTLTGPDGKSLIYEVFRAPGDFTSSITIPAGKRGVIAHGIEGSFETVVSHTSAGGPNQEIIVEKANFLDSPIFVTVKTGSDEEEWTVLFEAIERFGPNDKVVEVSFVENAAIFKFGDDVAGTAPVSGQSIDIKYRTGGGIRGRIGVGQIDEVRSLSPLPPFDAAVTVRFRNVVSSSGGTDKESLDNAKKRAPRDFALHNSIVTAQDYAQVASSFAHPAFGSVSKAVATIKTSLNANKIEIYVLAEDLNFKPTLPSAGLKAGLKTFYENLNVLTDYVEIFDGVLHPVDVDMTVVVDRNADAGVVKERVESAMDAFFNSDEWDMGQALHTSNLIDAINKVDGVAYVDLFSPIDNILATENISGGADDDKISPNELVVEGQRSINYFYQKG